VTINDGFDAFDGRVASSTDVDCTAGGTVSVSAATLQRTSRLLLGGTPSGAFDLALAAVRGPLIVRNDSGQTATLAQPTGASVALEDGKQILVYLTTSNVFQVGGAASALDELTDVDAPSPSEGEVLRFDGAAP